MADGYRPRACTNCKYRPKERWIVTGSGWSSPPQWAAYCHDCGEVVTVVLSLESANKYKYPNGGGYDEEYYQYLLSGGELASKEDKPIEIETCPNCHKNNIEILNIVFARDLFSAEIHCPRCEQGSLKLKHEIFWD